MNKKHQEERRAPVTSKMSIPSMVSIVMIIVGGSIAWGSSSENLKHIEAESKKHVNKDELKSTLKAQELKISYISSDVLEVKMAQKEFQIEQRAASKENRDLLIELLQRIPKKD